MKTSRGCLALIRSRVASNALGTARTRAAIAIASETPRWSVQRGAEDG
jgi:hypothetical protein